MQAIIAIITKAMPYPRTDCAFAAWLDPAGGADGSKRYRWQAQILRMAVRSKGDKARTGKDMAGDKMVEGIWLVCSNNVHFAMGPMANWKCRLTSSLNPQMVGIYDRL